MPKIDPCEISPLQGGSFIWKAPRVETLGWHPAAPSGQTNHPSFLNLTPFGLKTFSLRIRRRVAEGSIVSLSFQ
jgi:hypothetical protein